MEEERQRCRNAGMVGHVTKPVEINKLVKTMLKNIRQNIPAKLG
jgi:CheY-like chemotaxis protein